jgi:hypothetical protein
MAQVMGQRQPGRVFIHAGRPVSVQSLPRPRSPEAVRALAGDAQAFARGS